VSVQTANRTDALPHLFRWTAVTQDLSDVAGEAPVLVPRRFTDDQDFFVIEPAQEGSSTSATTWQLALTDATIHADTDRPGDPTVIAVVEVVGTMPSVSRRQHAENEGASLVFLGDSLSFDIRGLTTKGTTLQWHLSPVNFGLGITAVSLIDWYSFRRRPN